MAALAEVTTDGTLRLNFHPGQLRAWDSEARTVAVLAGSQGGKTSFGPYWLYREVQRRGPGSYLVVTPTFPLLELKALPEFRRLFEDRLQLGRYVGSPSRKFVFSEEGAERTFGRHDPDEPTVVHFGYAAEPDSLEAMTAKAAWLDEAGQKRFRLQSLEAVQRRLAIHRGRILITTTPYDLGWLKQKIHDPWQRGDPEIEVVRFDSTENPAFPPEEFERARLSMPRWRFDLFHRAVFTRPAGLIHEAFDPDRHAVERFPVPSEWRRYLGLDFGGVHTAGVFYAEEPGGKRLFAYREYLEGGRTSAGHVKALLSGEPPGISAVGGSHSEGQWRQEFGAAGLYVQEPAVRDVEVGIDRVVACHQRGEILVFRDLARYLDEKQSYAREVDESGNPTERIADKSAYHLMDAERYLIGRIRPGPPLPFAVNSSPTKRGFADAPPGVFGSGPQKKKGGQPCW